MVRNFGKICERNSNIKDIFKIKNAKAKEILLDEIKKERGEEIDEIQRLI